LINVPLGDVGVEVGALDEAEEELVDDLEVGPRELEHRFVLLGIVGVAGRVDGRRDRAEEVGGELSCVESGRGLARTSARRSLGGRVAE
jgi:hypothetical protein